MEGKINLIVCYDFAGRLICNKNISVLHKVLLNSNSHIYSYCISCAADRTCFCWPLYSEWGLGCVKTCQYIEVYIPEFTDTQQDAE